MTPKKNDIGLEGQISLLAQTVQNFIDAQSKEMEAHDRRIENVEKQVGENGKAILSLSSKLEKEIALLDLRIKNEEASLNEKIDNEIQLLGNKVNVFSGIQTAWTTAVGIIASVIGVRK